LWPEVDELLNIWRSENKGKPADEKFYLLEVLQALRTTFLQDSVAMKKDDPNHPIWQHPLFHTPEYVQWEADLTGHINRSREEKAKTNLDKVITFLGH
jgi:hypothetical protein